MIKNSNDNINGFVYDYPMITMILLLLIGLGFYLPFMIYRYVKWVKSSNIIDIKLYNKQVG